MRVAGHQDKRRSGAQDRADRSQGGRRVVQEGVFVSTCRLGLTACSQNLPVVDVQR